MTKEDLSITYENNIFYCTKNNTKWISVDGEKWYCEEKRIEELETRCAELFLQNNEFAERFAKSIEIIKELLPCCRNYPQENAEKMEQAEQFLKEIEK